MAKSNFTRIVGTIIGSALGRKHGSKRGLKGSVKEKVMTAGDIDPNDPRRKGSSKPKGRARKKKKGTTIMASGAGY